MLVPVISVRVAASPWQRTPLTGGLAIMNYHLSQCPFPPSSRVISILHHVGPSSLKSPHLCTEVLQGDQPSPQTVQFSKLQLMSLARLLPLFLPLGPLHEDTCLIRLGQFPVGTWRCMDHVYHSFHLQTMTHHRSATCCSCVSSLSH